MTDQNSEGKMLSRTDLEIFEDKKSTKNAKPEKGKIFDYKVMANIPMRGRWKPEIVPSTQLFYDINIMDNGLYTIFKNICSATFATDILNQCRLSYQSLGFDDVSKRGTLCYYDHVAGKVCSNLLPFHDTFFSQLVFRRYFF